MKDKVIELAREAGARDNGNEFLFNELRYLERFYNLVRAEYRKEIGEPIAYVYRYPGGPWELAFEDDADANLRVPLYQLSKEPT